MNITQFWQLIERTRDASYGDVNKHADLLVEELTKLSVEEIIEYQHIFDGFDEYADRRDIRDVANIIGGGLGDSGWTDFRGWLIGQGQVIYRKAVADPESLADVVEFDLRFKIEAENLYYAGQNAYWRKTNSEDMIPDNPSDEAVLRSEEYRSGSLPAKERTKSEKELYPKVWAKFGE